MALLFAFLDFGCQLVVTADTHTSLVNVAATFAIAAGKVRFMLLCFRYGYSPDYISYSASPGLAVLESPPFLNGEIGRRIGKQLQST